MDYVTKRGEGVPPYLIIAKKTDVVSTRDGWVAIYDNESIVVDVNDTQVENVGCDRKKRKVPDHVDVGEHGLSLSR